MPNFVVFKISSENTPYYYIGIQKYQQFVSKILMNYIQRYNRVRQTNRPSPVNYIIDKDNVKIEKLDEFDIMGHAIGYISEKEEDKYCVNKQDNLPYEITQMLYPDKITSNQCSKKTKQPAYKKEYFKEYYAWHKGTKTSYYEIHKDKIKEKSKAQYLNLKEKLKELEELRKKAHVIKVV